MSNPPPPGPPNPYDPPNQGWQQGQPGQPGQPGPAQNWQGQPSYGAPPPPPKKSRTGLIAALVVLVLLVAGGVVAAVLIAGGDDEKNGGDGNGKDETTLSGEKLSGEGYTYELPKEWKEATDEAKGQDAPGTIDTVSIWGEKLDGSQANVIVEASSGVGDASLDDLRATWESNMSGASGSTPQDYEGTTIDGEDAIGAKFERDNDSGTAIVQIAYLTVHDGTAYSVILSSQADKADEALAAYEDLLGSWAWEG
jgi:hypothetical protein